MDWKQLLFEIVTTTLAFDNFAFNLFNTSSRRKKWTITLWYVWQRPTNIISTGCSREDDSSCLNDGVYLFPAGKNRNEENRIRFGTWRKLFIGICIQLHPLLDIELLKKHVHKLYRRIVIGCSKGMKPIDFSCKPQQSWQPITVNSSG